jgi:hypothetical protein
VPDVGEGPRGDRGVVGLGEVDVGALGERRIEGERVRAAARAHDALDRVALGVVDVDEAGVEAGDEHAGAPPALAVDDRADLHARHAGRERDHVVEPHEVARAGRRHVGRGLADEQRRGRARGDVHLDRHRRRAGQAVAVGRVACGLGGPPRARIERDAPRVEAARRQADRGRAAVAQEGPVGRRRAVVVVKQAVDLGQVAVRHQEGGPVGDVAELAHEPRHRQRRHGRRPALQPAQHEGELGAVGALDRAAAARLPLPAVHEQAHQAPGLVRDGDRVAAVGRRERERLVRQRQRARARAQIFARQVRGVAAPGARALPALEPEALPVAAVVVDLDPRERRVAAHDHPQHRRAVAPGRGAVGAGRRGERDDVGRERAQRDHVAQDGQAVGRAPGVQVDGAAAAGIDEPIVVALLAEPERRAREGVGGARIIIRGALGLRGIEVARGVAPAPELGHRLTQLRQVERLHGAARVLQVEVAVDDVERRAPRRDGERGRKVQVARRRRRPVVRGKATRRAEQGGAQGGCRHRHPAGAATLHDARSVVTPHRKKSKKVVLPQGRAARRSPARKLWGGGRGPQPRSRMT